MCERCDSAEEIEQYRHRVHVLEKEARTLRKMIAEQQATLAQFELANHSMGLSLLLGVEAGNC